MEQYKAFKVEGNMGSKNYGYPVVALSKEEAIEKVIKKITFKLSNIAAREINVDEEIEIVEKRLQDNLEKIKEISYNVARYKVLLGEYKAFKGELTNKASKGIEHNLFKVYFNIGQAKRVKYFTGASRDEVRNIVTSIYGNVNIESVQLLDLDAEMDKADFQISKTEQTIATKNNDVIKCIAKSNRLKETKELCILSNRRLEQAAKKEQIAE